MGLLHLFGGEGLQSSHGGCLTLLPAGGEADDGAAGGGAGVQGGQRAGHPAPPPLPAPGAAGAPCRPLQPPGGGAAPAPAPLPGRAPPPATLRPPVLATHVREVHAQGRRVWQCALTVL